MGPLKQGESYISADEYYLCHYHIFYNECLKAIHLFFFFPGYFWHITDIHLDYFYSPKGEPLRSCWHSEHHSTSSNRAPGRFGDYLCDSPWSLLESATLAMKSRQGDNVEFVLWTG
ncbi:unnamed protein product [Hermetia illucens]|uniref:Uncharacterized protein n=1 Tax=Hermetia illucens TaxID=343691 RepID=A0A7R8YRU6_HERIL|nr:unnamed protein product [Hermetia illucens]